MYPLFFLFWGIAIIMRAGIITSASAVSLTPFSCCGTSADERVLLSGHSFASNSSVCCPASVKGCCTGLPVKNEGLLGYKPRISLIQAHSWWTCSRSLKLVGSVPPVCCEAAVCWPPLPPGLRFEWKAMVPPPSRRVGSIVCSAANLQASFRKVSA